MSLEEDRAFWALAASLEPDLAVAREGRVVYRMPIAEAEAPQLPPVDSDVLEVVGGEHALEWLSVFRRLGVMVLYTAATLNGMIPGE